MRSCLLPLAMLAVCAAPVALAAPAPAPAAHATASSAHEAFFIEEVNPDEILSYDGRMSVIEPLMRQTLAAPITVITTVPITTPPITTTPVTTFAGVDGDSDGYYMSQDCDDGNASIHPGATEVVNDGIDQNCDNVDSCYQDLDHDGFGSSATTNSADLTCTGVGVSGVSTDCLDSGTSGAIAAVDINPDAIEACDTIDNDCDGLIDDNDPNHEGDNFYADGDGDGFGAGTAIFACVAPDGTVSDNTDCDDANIAINGDAEDIAGNGVDDNCDGVIDGTLVDDTDTTGGGDGGTDTDDVLDTSDRGDGVKGEGAACNCNTSTAPSTGGLALALSFVGGLLARRRKV